MQFAKDYADSAIIVQLPTIMKASVDAQGRRMIEVQVSSQDPDLESDVIEQKALLDSATYFLKNGHLDIDHASELHSRLSLPGLPSDWIIGHPTEVVDIGDKRTSVRAEIRRSADGSFDPNTNRYDAFWQSVSTNPPVKWFSSIYGFPTEDGIIDCRSGTCPSGAQRFHIKALTWKSLAMTRKPVNNSLTEYAKVITAKSFIALIKSGNLPSYPPPPAAPNLMSDTSSHPHEPPSINDSGSRPIQNQGPFIQSLNGAPDASTQNMVDPMANPTADMPVANGNALTVAGSNFHMSAPKTLADSVGAYHLHMKRECPHTGGVNSVPGFRDHFTNCCGMAREDADLHAHALQHYLLLARRRGD